MTFDMLKYALRGIAKGGGCLRARLHARHGVLVKYDVNTHFNYFEEVMLCFL
ncbi:MAG: hypothetical protein NC240_09590 [Clostridium sp.]|nr:hypothetical protein [Clostridium sp.]